MNRLYGKLVCLDKFTYVDEKDVYVYLKDRSLNCIIDDFGIRFEYKHNHYTDRYKPSFISKYFKM